MANVVYHLISNDCPNCHQDHVFRNSNLFTYHKDAMNKSCPHCHMNFEKEPGFYWGAMYASYGLGVLECFLTYFMCRLFGTGTFDWINLYIIIAALVLLAPFNFRMARLIWLYLIP